MSVTELHAGFVSEAVRSVCAGTYAGMWHETLRNLSCFVVDDNMDCPDSADSILMVADNILSRGLPTLPRLKLEEYLANYLGLTKRRINRKTGSVSYRLVDESNQTISLIKQAMCLPAVSHLQRCQGGSFDSPSYGSNAERLWLETTLTRDSPFVAAKIERQRPLATIIGSRAKDFQRQDVDFAIELPEYGDFPKGFVFEIDGDQHETIEQQKHLDVARDAALRASKWRVVRIPASEVATITPALQTALTSIESHPYGLALRAASSGVVQSQELGQKILQMVHMPLCVARIQKVLVRMLCRNLLNIKSPSWRFAIIERDAPCGELAISDFRQFMEQLFAVEGCGRHLPEISLKVIPQRKSEGNREEGRQDVSCKHRYDAVLDISVSAMSDNEIGDAIEHEDIQDARIIRIRSTYSQRHPRRIMCGPAVEPAGLASHPRRKLTPIMRDIFRKVGFRKKQVDIVVKALSGQSVVALLPTGAGKSLTYQLSALLQPGIVIIVDPLKSLMRDQDDNLRKTGIDSTVFINSGLSRADRQAASQAMADGQYMFVFVSPERFLLPEFRQHLSNMQRARFSFCVVDEAHCVSEWGHDFRTAYLRLGANMRRFCASNRRRLPVVALTGTASYDVLADVQRELDFTLDEEAGLVQPDSYSRKELDFEVVEVTAPDTPLNSTNKAISEAVGVAKLQSLKNVLNSIAYAGNMSVQEYLKIEKENSRSGLVFCPHVKGKFGVGEIRNGLVAAQPSLAGIMGVYAGSIADDDGGDEKLQQTQRLFKGNLLNLLVATKAFGMGIDKPNIRFTAHISMPPSIEAFYQEAGRAGRDRGAASCKLLFCPFRGPDGVTVDKSLMLSLFKNSFKGQDRELAILLDLLDRITFAAAPGQVMDAKPGIEAILADLGESDPARPVVIGFDNGVADQVLALLAESAHGWNRSIVSNASEFCDSPTKYLSNLRYQYWKAYQNNATIRSQTTHSIERLFPKLRTSGDTFKAIYRLSIVGVIEDYEIDYNSKMITAYVKKLPDLQYVANLQQYIGRYVSVSEKLMVPEEVLAIDAPNMLRRCLHRLLRFVYERVAAKREEAIDTMENAAIAGIGNREAFRSYVDTYFDSRFTPRLRPFLQNYDLDTVWDFINEVGGSVDAAKHLRGACNRLLESNERNAALFLLRSYANFLITGERGSKEAAILDYRRGWDLFRQQGGWSEIEMRSAIVQFIEKTAGHDLMVVDWVGAEFVEPHSKWLKSFADNFTGGIEYVIAES